MAIEDKTGSTAVFEMVLVEMENQRRLRGQIRNLGSLSPKTGEDSEDDSKQTKEETASFDAIVQVTVTKEYKRNHEDEITILPGMQIKQVMPANRRGMACGIIVSKVPGIKVAGFFPQNCVKPDEPVQGDDKT